MSQSELAASYAALILADDAVDITADKLTTLIKAAGVTDFEPIYASLFAKVGKSVPTMQDRADFFKALEGRDVKELLLNVGSGGGGGAAAPTGAGAAGGANAAAEAPKEEEKKEEEKEESDEDMGFGLFD